MSASQAQNSTPTPDATKTETPTPAPGDFEQVTQDTVRQCRDAFRRVPELETALVAALAGKQFDALEVKRLENYIVKIEKNHEDAMVEARGEIKELREQVLKLTEIAAKRTKICLIC